MGDDGEESVMRTKEVGEENDEDEDEDEEEALVGKKDE